MKRLGRALLDVSLRSVEAGTRFGMEAARRTTQLGMDATRKAGALVGPPAALLAGKALSADAVNDALTQLMTAWTTNRLLRGTIVRATELGLESETIRNAWKAMTLSTVNTPATAALVGGLVGNLLEAPVFQTAAKEIVHSMVADPALTRAVTARCGVLGGAVGRLAQSHLGQKILQAQAENLASPDVIKAASGSVREHVEDPVLLKHAVEALFTQLEHPEVRAMLVKTLRSQLENPVFQRAAGDGASGMVEGVSHALIHEGLTKGPRLLADPRLGLASDGDVVGWDGTKT